MVYKFTNLYVALRVTATQSLTHDLKWRPNRVKCVLDHLQRERGREEVRPRGRGRREGRRKEGGREGEGREIKMYVKDTVE